MDSYMPIIGNTILIAFIVMFSLYWNERNTRIDPKLCPHVDGRYAVRPGLQQFPLLDMVRLQLIIYL